MMLSWLIYAVIIGVLIIVAASALDPVAGARKWPTRFVWLGAIAFALVWPVASAGRALLPAAAPRMLPFTYTLPAFQVGGEASATSFGVTFGQVLAIAWTVVSMLLLAGIVGAYHLGSIGPEERESLDAIESDKQRAALGGNLVRTGTGRTAGAPQRDFHTDVN